MLSCWQETHELCIFLICFCTVQIKCYSCISWKIFLVDFDLSHCKSQDRYSNWSLSNLHHFFFCCFRNFNSVSQSSSVELISNKWLKLPWFHNLLLHLVVVRWWCTFRKGNPHVVFFIFPSTYFSIFNDKLAILYWLYFTSRKFVACLKIWMNMSVCNNDQSSQLRIGGIHITTYWIFNYYWHGWKFWTVLKKFWSQTLIST